MKIVFLLFACLAVIACESKAKKYVAMVNDEGIERAEFEKVVEKNISMIEKSRGKIQPTQKAEFEKILLKRLIDERLLLQEAEKKGISFSEEQVSAFLNEIKARYPSEADFKKSMESQLVSESDLRKMLKNQKTIEALLNQEVFKTVAVSDQEVAQNYETQKAMYAVPEQMRASHILFKYEGPDDTPEAQRLKSRLNQVRRDIVAKKKSFADAARAYSDCPSKAEGGDLNFFSRGQMVPEFEKVVFSTPKGKISEVFKTQFGFHIVTVTDKKPVSQKTLPEVASQIKQTMINGKKQQLLQKYLADLKASAEIETFSKQ